MKDSYIKEVDHDWYRQRLSGAIICVFAAFLILLGRLYYLQIISGSKYRRLSENNCVRLRAIAPTRGLIFDRTGTLIVDNRPSFNLSIVLEDSKKPKEVVTRLSSLLDVPPEPLLTRLEERKSCSPFKPLVLKRNLSRDAVAVIEAHKLDLPGIVITVEPMRYYIEGKLACHVIGYLGEISKEELKSNRFPHNRIGDFVGKFGVEKAYESYFSGKSGRMQVQVNALGQITKILKTVDPIPGNNVYLTLDVALQRKTEKMLAGKVGAAVAMDPSNGNILALANSPSFDPNAFVRGMTVEEWKRLANNKSRPMENKVIQGQYPPASTFKIVTAMAALEEGVIDKTVKYYCRGYYRYGNRTYRDWKREGHGFINVVDALAQSCDVFFYKVGEKLGIDRLARYASGCGLGSPTGIDLDREAKGLVPTAQWKLRRIGVPWQGGETISVAIGQGFTLVTPIQMVTLISAVANGGMRYRPLVVSRIVSSDGSTIKRCVPEPLGKVPASDRTLQIITEGLIDAVNKRSGTGWIARVAGINVAGKTGTAQVVRKRDDEGERSHASVPVRFKDHAWFVAFAPAKEPRIAVAVLLEHAGHGATAAGPIAREMIKTYLGR